MPASNEQEWLQLIFDNISDAIIVLDRERVIRYANSVAARMAGFSKAGDLLNVRYDEILAETHLYDESGEVLPLSSMPGSVSLGAGGATYDRIIRQVNARDGTQHWLSISTVPILGEDGVPRFVIIFYRDISERKSKDDKLWFMVQSEKILSATADFRLRLTEKAKLIVPVLADWCTVNIVEEDGSVSRIAVVHRNPSKAPLLERYLELSETEGGSAQDIREVIRTGISAYYPVIADTELLQDAASDERHALAKALMPRSAMIVPIKSSEKVLGVLSLTYAESDRRYSREDLEFMEEFGYHLGVLVENMRLYKQIAERDASKDSFLAALSHELRNPLAPIRSSIELLHLRSQDPLVLEQVGIIEHQFEGMTKILSDLLDVTRYTQGKVSLELMPLDARTIVEHVTKANRSFFSKRNLTLEASIPEEPVRLLADETRLEQALTNILHNAEKFSIQGGSVHIGLSAEEGVAKIVIRDDGIGIDSSDLARIFDRSFQSMRNYEHQKSGLGLGLVLVREIVTLHGGTIEAQSDGVGLGSSFTLSLPLSDAVLQPEEQSHAPADVTEQPSKKILIADDNVAAAEGLKKLLAHRGHEVATAHDGFSMLEHARSFQPDVVLLDIGLPDLDGYEVARRFRSEFGSGAKLIALTGYGQDEDKRRASDAGFDHHLTKPAGIREIEAIISPSSMFEAAR